MSGDNTIMDVIPGVSGTVKVAQKLGDGDIGGAVMTFVQETTEVADKVAPVLPAARVVSAIGHGIKATSNLSDGNVGAAVQEGIAVVAKGQKGAGLTGLEAEANLANVAKDGGSSVKNNSVDQGLAKAVDGLNEAHISELNMEAAHHNAWKASVSSGGAGTGTNHGADVASHTGDEHPENIVTAGVTVDDHMQNLGNTAAGKECKNTGKNLTQEQEPAKPIQFQSNKQKQTFAVKYFQTCGKMASQVSMGLLKENNKLVQGMAGLAVAWQAVSTLEALMEGKASLMGVAQQGMQFYMMANPEAAQKYMAPMMAMNMVGGGMSGGASVEAGVTR
ncbi:MAG: hypothetical protein SFT90_03170 [Rickettsiales bacterium]|nr:hypothetical protein [Rickettsiales bacterium]